MKFGVKFLAILLVSVFFATMLSSCFSTLDSDDGSSSNDSIDSSVVNPPKDPDGNDSINTSGSIVLDSITMPYIADVLVSMPVEPDEGNKVPAGGVSLSNPLASATIPSGVQLETGATKVTLTINGIKDSKADIELLKNEVSSSFDVHVSGVAKSNSVPMMVKLTAAAAKGLNSTSIKLYHVENDETIEMTLIRSGAEFTDHNQFKYDPATGDVTLYIASFSEFALVADTENKWMGGVDHSWYKSDATELIIANAEQLWSLSQIVGGMNGQTQDSFNGKTVKLISNINLGDIEAENNPDIIFYPIGYYNSEGTYERTGTAITSGLRNFEGTFDGNGHTIANFYQNTWEMKGDHSWYDATLQYYNDGMGLFGRVYGGTVKNLTVSGFSSDGEITTTGVIAAYADFGATFKNISIFNSNPRVYNIGNGGIVGCVGWYTKGVTEQKVTFENITVDNSNKISALWGSYDVACGGIVGQYYPTSGQSSANYPVNAGIKFKNCHVSAVMDVYNDVCANYQYYAYRYTGMFIGSIRENETIDGKVYPKMDGIEASGCTVHFGDWNDYYYCELVANSLASYTHDHQMSRLTQVAAVDTVNMTVTDLNGNTIAIPTDGRVNYVVVKAKDSDGKWIHGDGHEFAECYHFVNGVQHLHDVADPDNPNPTEIVDDVEVLKEDKQLIYREFNQLFTGYGWGVTSVGLTNFENVNIKDKVDIDSGEAEGSQVKFEHIGGQELAIGKEYTLGDLFIATGLGEAIKNSNVIVTVSPSSGNTEVNYLYDINEDDWSQSTLTINTPDTNLVITITDYYFCKSTSATVSVTKANKFEYLYGENSKNHKDFLLRVGNSNAVSLDLLFGEIAGYSADLDSLTVEVPNGTFTKGNTFGTSTISFAGYTGIATITIYDGTSIPCTIKVEVVNGKNVTALENATSNNIVLLKDATLSSLAVSGRYAFYGNGFTLTYSGNGQYLNNGLKQGVVSVSGHGILDNVRIEAPVYPYAYMYYGSTSLGSYVQGGPSSVEGGKTRYHYQLSAVALSENGTVSNCYIYGGRNNIFVNTGDVTIKDTVLECGTVANIQIQSNESHTITLENVTTIQYKVTADFDGTKTMLGAGILVGPETDTNPAIALNGTFKQYNWVNEDDSSAVSDEAAQKIIDAAVDATDYNHTINGKTYSNLGIIYMNTSGANVTNSTGLPYVLGTISISGIKGQAYSLQEAKADQIYSDYANADRSTVNGYYTPQFSYSEDLGGQLEEKSDDKDSFLYREGDTVCVMFPSGETKEVDLGTLVDISKYTGDQMKIDFICLNSKGEMQEITDNKVVLSVADTYTITYTLTDTSFFDKDGNPIDKSITYSWTVKLDVSLKDTASPDARFEFDATKQKMGYYKPSIGDVKQYLPFLAGLKIYDYIGQTEYLRFDGSSDFNKVASITITGYASNKASVEIKLTDGGVINTSFLARANSGGGSTYTGKIKTSNNTIYFVTDSGTSNKDATTTAAYWYVDYYKFTGNNGVAIQSGQQTFNSSGSSASTPSGNFSTSIKYTVNYDANGGNCGQTVGYATSAATAVTLPTPSRSGYIFAGWYTATTSGTRIGGAGDSYTPNANITLYAQWGKPCTVTYDANGGSCGTAAEKYTGTALTLPTPTRDGYWFVGWYDAKEGGNKIGDAGASYTPSAEITLYAHWQEKVEYTVTYNANGGSCGTASATYQGSALTLPTPTRTGHTFNGWYNATTGGNKIGDAGASYIPSANITLYAQWTVNSYTITVTSSNATVKVNGTTVNDKGTVSVQYGASVTVDVSYTEDDKQSTTITGTDGTTYDSPFTMPAQNVTINATSSNCVTPDTLVTLANGTQVRVDSLTGEEELLVWNLETGKLDKAPIMFVDSESEAEFEVIRLIFSDGTEVKVIYEHGFWDYDLNKYVYLDRNASDYIGHYFAKQNGESLEKVQLTEVIVETMITSAWSPVTAGHLCYFVNGMLSMPGGVGGLFNIFEVDSETMTYDYESMAADIEKYGLFTYEEMNAIVPLSEEMFELCGGAYLKISIAKGNMTIDDLIYMVNRYSNYY